MSVVRQLGLVPEREYMYYVSEQPSAARNRINGHQCGWCPRCDAIEKRMNRLPPDELVRGIRKLNGFVPKVGFAGSFWNRRAIIRTKEFVS